VRERAQLVERRRLELLIHEAKRLSRPLGGLQLVYPFNEREVIVIELRALKIGRFRAWLRSASKSTI
jgi:hypothetical protein